MKGSVEIADKWNSRPCTRSGRGAVEFKGRGKFPDLELTAAWSVPTSKMG